MATLRRDNLEAALGSERANAASAAMKSMSFWTIFNLGYESLGVVYGDVGTSPLYVYATTFSNGIAEEKDIIGVLSLILWSLTLSPLVKYCFVVLTCDDHGEGGTFAIYSLLCRHVSLGRLRNYAEESHNLSSYRLDPNNRKSRIAASFKTFLEGSGFLQSLILVLVLLATCMIIGDGVLTPAQSVLSAIAGIGVRDSGLSQHVIVGVSCVILALLFLAQVNGTHRIAFTFAPIILLWFVTIFTIGIYHLSYYNGWGVWKALSPHYGIAFLLRNKKTGWIQLGGIFLTITGTEAMFADISHFSPRSIQYAFALYVYPCLMVSYAGQAAYLRKHPEHVSQTFYKAIPDPVYWPVFVIATAAAAIASQAMITATFTIVKQSMALGCFPPVKVVHTSKDLKGQIFIPEINLILMVLTLLVTAIMGEKPYTIGNAYGIAVSAVMLITTQLVTIALIVVKKRSPWVWVPFFLFYTFAETVYLSSNLYKFPHGGWVPIAFAGGFMIVMCTWRYGTVKKSVHTFENKLSIDWVQNFANTHGEQRVPGVGLFYSELASGIPPIFAHFVHNVPVLHEFVVFVSVKHIEVPTVDDEERFFFRRLGPLKLRTFRCIVRYGYSEARNRTVGESGNGILDEKLVHALADFIRTEDPRNWRGRSSSNTSSNVPASPGPQDGGIQEVGMSAEEERNTKAAEVIALIGAQRSVVVHILGRSYLTAKKDPKAPIKSLWRHFMIDYAFHFLKVNTRDSSTSLKIPKANLLEVGMPCEI